MHSIAIRCTGPSGHAYAARTVDISRGGALIEIVDPDFHPLLDGSDLMPFAAQVSLQFPDGMLVNFESGTVQARANIVRLVSKQGKKPGILLGCAFAPELSEFDCRVLGMTSDHDETTAPVATIATDVVEREPEEATADDEDAAAPAHATPAPRQPALSTWASADTVVVHLFPSGAPLHGPRFVGCLTDVRVRTMHVELPAPDSEDDPGSWAAGLGAFVRTVCMRDGRVLWETRARVTHVASSERGDWARATLVAVKAPPLHVRRLLRLEPVAV